MSPERIRHFVPDVPEAALAAVVDALRARRLSSGAGAARLEAAIAESFGGLHVVAVSSGTAALYLALQALGIRRGDRVCIPSYTCNSLFAAVAHAGADAVCADSGPDSLVVTPETVRRASGGGAAAAIVAHTCGFAADVSGIRALGLPVVEDCAHAAGGYYPDGSRLGSKGDLAVFSFFATKLLPSGEGGACVTRSAEQAGLIRRLRNCDERSPDPRAFNFRMNDLCAAVALAQWQALPAQLAARAELAAVYDAALSPWACRGRGADAQRVCFRYLVEARPDADAFVARAGEAGVEARRPIFRPLHYALGGDCPRSEDLHRTVVSLPSYPGLSQAERARVCAAARAILASTTSRSAAAAGNEGRPCSG